MKCFTNEELKTIYHGAYSFQETKGDYLQAFQYTAEQMAYFRKASDFWHDRCMASSAKTLEFITEAVHISFDYRIIWTGSQDSFELSIDGLITDIRYVKHLEPEGTLNWLLPKGKKSVTIYLPADATVLIRHLEADADLEKVFKGPRVLWLGDSITQGYGPLRSGETYVSVANRLLGWEIINQGIGGYVYDKNSLMPMPGYTPDKIVIALGTNQYGASSMRDVEDFYESLMALYGSCPKLCISPLWRGDNPSGIPTLVRFCKNVMRIAGQYSSVSVVDGFTLVPHLQEYYLDSLHPNCLGSEVYGRSLTEAVRALRF